MRASLTAGQTLSSPVRNAEPRFTTLASSQSLRIGQFFLSCTNKKRSRASTAWLVSPAKQGIGGGLPRRIRKKSLPLVCGGATQSTV